MTWVLDDLSQQSRTIETGHTESFPKKRCTSVNRHFVQPLLVNKSNDPPFVVNKVVYHFKFLFSYNYLEILIKIFFISITFHLFFKLIFIINAAFLLPLVAQNCRRM